MAKTNDFWISSKNFSLSMKKDNNWQAVIDDGIILKEYEMNYLNIRKNGGRDELFLFEILKKFVLKNERRTRIDRNWTMDLLWNFERI